MSDEPFDPWTSLADRLPHELWLPFADPVERAKRDAIYGETPAQWDKIVEYEEQQRAKQRPYVTPQEKRRYRKAKREHQQWLVAFAKTIFNPPEDKDNGCFTLPPGMTIAAWQQANACEPPRGPRLPTDFITREEASRVHRAIRYANFRGAIMNVELTITWTLAGFETAEAINGAYEDLMERFRKFAEHHKIWSPYYAVFETGPEFGCHCHIGLHFPYALGKELRAWLRRTVRTVDGSPCLKRVVECTIRDEVSRPGAKDNRFVAQHEWFRYCMKGLNPKVTRAEKLEFGKDTTANRLAGVDQRKTGCVEIKRVRIARTINRGAETQWSFEHPLFGDDSAHRFDDFEYKRGEQRRMAVQLYTAMQNLEVI